TVGRDPGSAVPLVDPLVSRKHAVIRRQADGKFLLLDLGSTHGTYLGGKRVSGVLLSDGDEIRLGSTTLRFEDRDKRGFSVDDVLIDPTEDFGAEEKFSFEADPQFPLERDIEDVAQLRRD